MKIFISYAQPDREIALRLRDLLQGEAEVLFWEQSKVPGANGWASITAWIEQADVIVAIITENTIKRGLAVGKEIGMGIAKGKLLIPLVESRISARPGDKLDFLAGNTWLRFEVNALEECMPALRQQIESTRKQKWTGRIVLAGVAGLFLPQILEWLSGKPGKDE